jgi:hypothetical protein
MGGRTKPNWVYFEGGPLNGTRRLLGPVEVKDPLLVYTAGSVPGMRSGHVYRLTLEYRRSDNEGGMKLGPARVARFVQSCPEESVPEQSLHRLGGGGPS